jgi:hypothetical protein
VNETNEQAPNRSTIAEGSLDFEARALKLKEKGWGRSLFRAVSVVCLEMCGGDGTEVSNRLWQCCKK